MCARVQGMRLMLLHAPSFSLSYLCFGWSVWWPRRRCQHSPTRLPPTQTRSHNKNPAPTNYVLTASRNVLDMPQHSTLSLPPRSSPAPPCLTLPACLPNSRGFGCSLPRNETKRNEICNREHGKRYTVWQDDADDPSGYRLLKAVSERPVGEALDDIYDVANGLADEDSTPEFLDTVAKFVRDFGRL